MHRLAGGGSPGLLHRHVHTPTGEGEGRGLSDQNPPANSGPSMSVSNTPIHPGDPGGGWSRTATIRAQEFQSRPRKFWAFIVCWLEVNVSRLKQDYNIQDTRISIKSQEILGLHCPLALHRYIQGFPGALWQTEDRARQEGREGGGIPGLNRGGSAYRRGGGDGIGVSAYRRIGV